MDYETKREDWYQKIQDRKMLLENTHYIGVPIMDVEDSPEPVFR